MTIRDAIESLEKLDYLLIKNNSDGGEVYWSVQQALEALYNSQDEEWFFRWIARGKAGHTPMDLAIDILWHSPNNPYKDHNPWQEKTNHE